MFPAVKHPFPKDSPHVRSRFLHGLGGKKQSHPLVPCPIKIPPANITPVKVPPPLPPKDPWAGWLWEWVVQVVNGKRIKLVKKKKKKKKGGRRYKKDKGPPGPPGGGSGGASSFLREERKNSWDVTAPPKGAPGRIQCSQPSRPDCRALASNSPVRPGRG